MPRRTIARIRAFAPVTSLPFLIPVIRNGFVIGVTRDELEVPFVVRARIEKP